MTISSSPIVITYTDWILQRNDSMILSENKTKMFKGHFSQEIPKSPSLVSSLKLGDHTLEPQEGWIGLSQYHGKYITMNDLSRVTCRAMVSMLILNISFTPAER